MTLPAHFDLDNDIAYRAWRERKLAAHPRVLDDLVVEVRDPRHLSDAERQAIVDCHRRANMALYASGTGSDPDKEIPRLLGLQLGLRNLDANFLADDDGISPLSVAAAGTRTEFIPYTNRGIKWHTDGYYNTLERQVHAVLLHCVRSAEAGGGNQLLDHEVAYILLRDEDPEHIRALTAADALTIPPRMDGEAVARAAQSGPVFAVYPDGHLHMRYTMRATNVEWKQDERTGAALAALERLLAAELPWKFHGRLEPGMGLVCNNVLHDRSPFTDSEGHRRLLYRARYYDRVAC